MVYGVGRYGIPRSGGAPWTPNVVLSQLGWWYDADKGITVLGAQNTLRQSELLTDAAWQKANAVVTLDGPTGMFRVTDNVTNGTHYTNQSSSIGGAIGASTAIRFTLDVAAGTATRCLLAINGAAQYIDFNLTTGAGTPVGAGISVVSVTNVGSNGTNERPALSNCWRVEIQGSHVLGTDVRLYVIRADGTITYAGVGDYFLASRTWYRSVFTSPYIVTGATAADDPNGVMTWGDQSGNARHAAQSVYTAQPSFVSSYAAAGNRSVVLLDGASDYLTVGGTSGSNDNDWIIAAVLVPLQTASAPQHAWFSNRGVDFDTVAGGLQGYAGLGLATDIYIGYNSTASLTTITPFSYLTGATPTPANNPGPSIANSAAHVHVLRAAGGQTRHYVDSVTPRAALTQTHSSRVTVGRLGWDEATATFFKGAYREILAVRGSLSDAHVANLIRYLGRKGGVPIAA